MFTICNLNNNDDKHEIIFLNLTQYAIGCEKITVLFDGVEYSSDVLFDSCGNRSFRKCGKTYHITDEKGDHR